MFMNKLVSIITPCYNGEKFVSRFLDSILAQSYNYIELIIINDGSTDNTENIILSYEKKFKEKNYRLIYIKQENSGQSEAINKGLSIFKGEYLTWLDSDDFLPSNAIKTKVDFLNSNKKYGTVVSKIQVVEEDSFKNLGLQERIRPKGEETIFYDLIIGKNVFYTPGGYMVRTSMFKDAMPNPLQIEAPREIGQNYQLLLPIVYKYPVGYINDICYYYVVRRDSHSHVRHTYEDQKAIIEVIQRTLLNITKELTYDDYEIKKITKAIQYKIIHATLENMYLHKTLKDLEDVKRCMNNLQIVDRTLNILIKRLKFSFFDYVYRIYKFIARQTSKVFR